MGGTFGSFMLGRFVYDRLLKLDRPSKPELSTAVVFGDDSFRVEFCVRQSRAGLTLVFVILLLS